MGDNKVSVRSIAPFTDLKDPTNTIYDHLPYVKDITLDGINKIQNSSGNIVKRWNIDPDTAPLIIDTSELQMKLMDDFLAKEELRTADLASRKAAEDLDNESAVDEFSGTPVASEEIQPQQTEQPDVSLLNASEDDDDFSFLND